MNNEQGKNKLIRFEEGKTYTRKEMAEITGLEPKGHFNRDIPKLLLSCGYRFIDNGKTASKIEWTITHTPTDIDSIIAEYCIRVLHKYPTKNCEAYAMIIYLLMTDSEFQCAPDARKLEILNSKIKFKIQLKTMQNTFTEIRKDKRFNFQKKEDIDNEWITLDCGHGVRERRLVCAADAELKKNYKEYLSDRVEKNIIEKKKSIWGGVYLDAWRTFGVYFFTPMVSYLEDKDMDRDVQYLMLLVETKLTGLDLI